ADTGLPTFSVPFKTLANQTVTATDQAAGLSVTGGPVSVTGLAAVSFTVAAPASTTAGAPFDVTVTAKDSFGNVDAGYRGMVQLGSNDLQATLPAAYTFTAADNGVRPFIGVVLQTVGTRTVTATDTVNVGLSGSTSVAVAPAAATHLTLAAPPSATAGAALDVTVTAVDAFGNVDPG